MDSPILRHQRKFNRATRDAWAGFAPHRARMMTSILAAAGGRLLILGAGNVNDVELPRLLERFDEVHLVDVDEEALALGVARQGVPRGAVHVRGGVDVSGISEHLDEFWRAAPDGPAPPGAVSAAAQAAGAFPAPALGGPFDVVASACLLTQLVDQVVNTLGPEHPGTPRLAAAVRDRHLRLLLELAAPGGVAVLATDVMSTAVHAELAAAPDDALDELLYRCARDGRCFAGTDPVRMAADLAALPAVARATRSAPWKWAVGSLTFLVYAMSVEVGRRS